jgi:DNA-binding winged helix-turn-helix (wHTH) protein
MPAIPLVYEFGAFRLNSAERLLLKAGRPVSLTPKAFDLLVYLVERPGRLVTKQELLSAIWQDTFVEETNLTYTVSALRKALGDGEDTDPLIQTVPTRGYRFVAPVTREANASISPTSERPARPIQPLVRRLGIAALAVAVIAILAILFHRSPETTEPHTRFTIPLPDSVVNAGSFPQAQIAVSKISPDGRSVAFIVRSVFRGATVPRIWIRRLDALDADEISGSDGAISLFWAPDSQRLGFLTRTGLKKLGLSDGAVQTLCDPCQDSEGGGTWSTNGLIVFPSQQGFLLGIREGAGPPRRSRASTDRMVRLPISHLSSSQMASTSCTSSKMSIQSVAASTSDRLVPANANCWRRVSSRRSTPPLDICSSLSPATWSLGHLI